MIKVGMQAISAVNSDSYTQLIRFVLSGGLATASHWLVMAFAISLGVIPVVATAIGAIIGAVVNYILQRNVTFQSNTPHRSALQRYLIVCLLIWAANLFFFFILYHISLLSAVYAQGITTFVVAFMSYLLFKKVVFHDHQSQ